MSETQSASESANPSEAKQRLRSVVRQARGARDPEARQLARDGLTEQLSVLVTARAARSVSCYLPVPGEPDTSGFIAWAQEHGIDVLLPVSREDRSLEWARLSPAGTRSGLHGIPEPIGERLPATILNRVDLLLIPACAVDERGMRLGWGLGYYDRLLASLTHQPPTFAIVHDDELISRIPTAPHDIPISGAVTPTRTALFRSDQG